MATRGYAATSISDIRKACGLPPSSIYWHFGSKEGVLAAVMERGAQRYFAAIPAEAEVERQLDAVVNQQSQHPDFLRLFLLLSLERSDDRAVAEVVRRVRDTAIARFRDAIAQLIPADVAGPEGPARHCRTRRDRGRAVGRHLPRRSSRTRNHGHRPDVPAAVSDPHGPDPNPVGGEMTAMSKTAIITGASAGLGLECARALLANDPSWHVVLAVRDTARGAEAVGADRPPGPVHGARDGSRVTEVRARLRRRPSADAGLPPLHAVVCNAGLQVVSGTERTADGVEMTFGVNHLGHFALVQGAARRPGAAGPHRRRQQRHPRSGQAHRDAVTAATPRPPISRIRPAGDPRRRPPPLHHVQAVQRALHLRTRPSAGPRRGRRHRQRIRSRPDAGLRAGPRLPAAAAVGVAIPVSRAACSAQRQQRANIRPPPRER